MSICLGSVEYTSTLLFEDLTNWNLQHIELENELANLSFLNRAFSHQECLFPRQTDPDVLFTIFIGNIQKVGLYDSSSIESSYRSPTPPFVSVPYWQSFPFGLSQAIMNMTQVYNLYYDLEGKCSKAKTERNKVVRVVLRLNFELATCCPQVHP